MDLSLLAHLSDRALAAEAQKRGIDPKNLGREELIRRIRATEALAVTLPPVNSPKKPGAARAFLDKVVDFARTRIRSEPPPAPSVPDEPDEPIRTRSMARLLEEQEHYERAHAIVEELHAQSPDDPELVQWRDRLSFRIDEQALRERARERLGAMDAARVEILRAARARAVVWKVDEAALLRARALLGTRGTLTLRVVRVLAHPDHSVESRQEDRRPLESSGWAHIDVPASAKLVVSVGVAEGERFVSVAHAAG